MDITLEQVEKVRSCTGCSYEEAKAALRETGGNVLDVVILLERRRGAENPGGGDYSTRGQEEDPRDSEPSWRKPTGREVWQAIKSLLANCLAISLEIWKSGRMTCMIPLIIAVILVLVAPYVSIGLALVGLCVGYRIHISGKGTEDWGAKVNQVMDQIGDTVSDAFSQLRGDHRKSGKKK